MDFWTALAFNAVLQLLGDKKQYAKFGSVIAKVYVKIEKLAQLDQRLTDAIRLQRAKEGLDQ